jgi:fructokinase
VDPEGTDMSGQPQTQLMIAVVGEALIDLVVDADGRFRARPGGGPFNVARTVARLGQKPAFLGRLSQDRFGVLLRASLDHDGVTPAIPEAVAAPTTLAVVDLDSAGAASYGFYLTGTSAAAVEYPLLVAALPAGTDALHVGSLGLVMEPIATSIERLIGSDLPQDAIVMIDPNCRPGAIGDPARYRDRISRIMRRADVVKVAAEDLGYLFPDAPTGAAAAALRGQGAGLILVTDGPRSVRALMADGEISVAVPQVDVVDTIGAGDAFGGAFLAWWAGNQLTRSELGRPETVRAALEAAVEVSALTCTHTGAEPPWSAELAGHPGWAWLAGPPAT